jgi:hypothetical protein
MFVRMPRTSGPTFTLSPAEILQSFWHCVPGLSGGHRGDRMTVDTPSVTLDRVVKAVLDRISVGLGKPRRYWLQMHLKMS